MSPEPLYHSAPLNGLSFLVTGGAGFIGSHLAHYLLEHGAQVRVMDNLSTGSRNNLESLQRFDRFEFFFGDIRSRDDCLRACMGMHYVFHQAALPSVSRSVEDPQTTHEVNCDGFFHMLQAARAQGVRRMVYASSSSVYGDHPALPKREGDTGMPLSPYAASKRTNELYAAAFVRNYGMEVIGLRYFNVFGPRQDPHSPYAAVIPRFVAALRNGQPPVIYGDGQQTRDFTYISNAIQANIRAAFTREEQAIGQVFNVACGEAHSVLDLFHCIKAAMRSNGKALAEDLQPQHAPPRAGDIRHSQADISLAQRWLGYQPTVMLQEGLQRLIASLQ
ncbi:MAG: SDR family oxidoreductase [Chitinophagales bacterium]|nr:SDR family oxidoreductase [Chitinophagales bacterium]MDW8393582.1 SDR family oxidoreductase [Chitinophagales bacterium]